jgi:hypothetical protein
MILLTAARKDSKAVVSNHILSNTFDTIVEKVFFCRQFCQNLRDMQWIYHYKSISEQLSVATLKFVTCGKWRHGWTTLL